MASSTATAGQTLRIRPEDLLRRMQAGEPVTIVDGRNPQAYLASKEKIRGAFRIEPDQFHVDPNWPKNQLTVAY